eukprot:6795117-Karenia_brevis.AAC.1
MDDNMKQYSGSVDSIEEKTVDRLRDLEEEMGQTMKNMVKDLERERRISMDKMTNLVLQFRKEMFSAEEKLLEYSRS